VNINNSQKSYKFQSKAPSLMSGLSYIIYIGYIAEIYKWLPKHEQDIEKTYHHKASDGYQNTMYRVRKGIDKGEWIPV
jgi:hypothetical protein